MTLLYLVLAWTSGIILGHLLWSQGIIGCETSGWPFAALSGAAFLSVLLLRQRRTARLVSFLVLMFLLGGWRYHVRPFDPCPTPSDLAFYNDPSPDAAPVILEGNVVGYPDVRDLRTGYRIRVERLTADGEALLVRGDALLQTPVSPTYRYGDRLRVKGYLQVPPVFDDFDYRAYLARQGIYSLVRRPNVELVARDQGSPFWAGLYGLRTRSSQLLNRVLPEPAAALANGMLLGIEGSISPEVEEAYRITGAAHVIVISGSNIALLVGFLLALFTSFVGRRRAVPPVLICVALYVMLVGADAPALRAGLMGALFVIAIVLGRQSTAWVALVAAAWLMTILHPLVLWDAGFQLSFAATLGLVLFTPAIAARLESLLAHRMSVDRARGARRFLDGVLTPTLAAQVLLLPLIVYYFGRLSPVSLLTNLLILPAQPPILAGGMATLAAGLVWEPLGRIVAAVPWLFLAYTTAVVRLAARAPLASIEVGRLGLAPVLVYYCLLVGGLGLRRLRPRLALWGGTGLAPIATGRALALGAAVLLPAWVLLAGFRTLPDGKLHLLHLPGEEGEATLVITPSGRRAWVWDGRGDGAALAQAARRALPAMRRTVDVAVMPESGLAQSSEKSLWPAAQVIVPSRLAAGASVRLDEGVTFTRLHDGTGQALALSYGNFHTLLPVTLMPEVQESLLETETDLRVTLLKAPGPGSGAWPTGAFLFATAPQVILLPEETTYPPDVEVELAARGAIRIPPEATVEVITDGARLWLRQWAGTGGR